ncbi:DUF3540 domain-containing protein [Desulfonatronum parangueonense]
MSSSAVIQRSIPERQPLRVVHCRRQNAAPVQAPELCTALVREGRADGDGRMEWHVTPLDGAAGEDVMVAARAAGCLLEPAPGDLVLVMRQPGRVHYLLHVLEKKETASLLRFPGDLSIVASRGKCSLEAEELALTANKSGMMSARELTLAGQEGRMRFFRLDVMAKTMEARIQSVRAFCEKIRLAASHLTARLGRVVRLTGFELHRARSVSTEVEERFAVQAGQVSILAKDEVTVDAEKIHLG